MGREGEPLQPGEHGELLRSILHNALDAVVLMDERGFIRDWNPQAETMFGWPAAEAIDKPLDQLIIPERYRAQHRRGLIRFLETGKGPVIGQRIELEALRRDGSELNVELSIGAHPVGSGWLFVGFVRDISRRKRDEETLRASEKKFQDLYDNAPDMYLSTKIRTGEIFECNAACTRQLGWSKAELIGRSVFDLYDPSCSAEAERGMQLLLERGEVHDLELKIQRKDGSYVEVSSSATGIRDALGRTSRSRINWRDITERKRMAELREKSQELVEQNRRALESSRLKGEFLANMSHELRTPLNAILGFAELLHDQKVGSVSAQQKEFLGDILTSGRHLLTLINDVLDLSKIEAGKMVFRPEPVVLAEVTREVGDILREMVAKKKLKMKSEIDPSIVDVHLDPAKLKQVLYNYLSNAIKFTPEGGTITLQVTPEDSESFRISVTDTGIGIAKEDLPRLFVEFQQLDGSSSKRYAGTGLGLALTRRIVTNQGGRVGVESKLGAGSTFYAVLPRRQPASSS